MSEPTCQQCRHWHRMPTDPHNLGAAPMGQCRLEPKLLVLPMKGGLELSAVYLATQATFAACSHFSQAVQTKEVRG